MALTFDAKRPERRNAFPIAEMVQSEPSMARSLCRLGKWCAGLSDGLCDEWFAAAWFDRSGKQLGVLGVRRFTIFRGFHRMGRP
jgi:hypothetical protein